MKTNYELYKKIFGEGQTKYEAVRNLSSGSSIVSCLSNYLGVPVESQFVGIKAYAVSQGIEVGDCNSIEEIANKIAIEKSKKLIQVAVDGLATVQFEVDGVTSTGTEIRVDEGKTLKMTLLPDTARGEDSANWVGTDSAIKTITVSTDATYNAWSGLANYYLIDTLSTEAELNALPWGLNVKSVQVQRTGGFKPQITASCMFPFSGNPLVSQDNQYCKVTHIIGSPLTGVSFYGDDWTKTDRLTAWTPYIIKRDTDTVTSLDFVNCTFADAPLSDTLYNCPLLSKSESEYYGFLLMQKVTQPTDLRYWWGLANNKAQYLAKGGSGTCKAWRAMFRHKIGE